MIKKIVILSDFIRYYIYNYDVTKQYMVLLSHQLTKATNLPIKTIFEIIDVDKFMQLNNLSSVKYLEKDYIWAYYYNNITKEAEEYLCEVLRDCLVVSYHSTDLILNVLQRNNIPFVDTFETAYRFMQDSYLGFRTNIDDARKYLLDKSLSVNTMYTYAGYLKAFYIHRQCYTLDDNSCLLVGQTSRDAVLIKKDSSFVSLLDYKDQINEISKQYKIFYYKMHPLEPLSKDIKEFLFSIPNAVEVTDNFYELMSQEGIKEVFGLNSGAISEAKFFGKKRTFLFNKAHSYYQDEGDIKNQQTFIIINSNSYIFKINFWANLLSSVIPTYKVVENEEVSFDNYQSLFSNFIRISSSYEFNIYSMYDTKKILSDQEKIICNLEDKYSKLQEKYLQQEGRLNYLFSKRTNRLKRISLNIFCAFIPFKQWRKEFRNKYLNQ